MSVSQNHASPRRQSIEQVLDEERGRDHAHAIVHGSSAPELAHAGVDDRIAGPPLRPGAKALVVVAPGKALEFWPQRTRRDLGMGEEERRGEVAPAELGHEFFRVALQAGPRRGGALDGGDNPPG